MDAFLGNSGLLKPLCHEFTVASFGLETGHSARKQYMGQRISP